jgi:restriction endonuclease S subunit
MKRDCQIKKQTNTFTLSSLALNNLQARKWLRISKIQKKTKQRLVKEKNETFQIDWHLLFVDISEES